MNDFKPLEEELKHHMASGALPGCVVCVAASGGIAHMQALGYGTTLPDKIPTRANTVYDVASLTKPLVTAAQALLMVQDGRLDLSATLGDFFSPCTGDKALITVLDLLTHRSGMAAWFPLFARGHSIAEYSKTILELPLKAPPRTRAIYSCLGYIMLAAVAEKVSGEGFITLASREVLEKLDLRRSWLGLPGVDLRQVAATEDSSFYERAAISEFGETFDFRRGIILGETHDTNSWAAGGCAGNAGLFSTAEEVLRLAEQCGPRSVLFDPDVIELIGLNETPFGPEHRTVGWMLASSPGSSAGRDFSPSSIGHTGFTGCSVWYDIERDITVVFLSNRIHPQVTAVDFRAVRRGVNSLAYRAVA